MKFNKFLCVILCLALAAALFAGCSSQAPVEDMGAMNGYYDGVYDSMEYAPAEPATKEETTVASNQKLVRRMSVEAETDDLDAALLKLQQKVEELGGYIEEQSIRNGSANAGKYRYAQLTVRVPAKDLDSFVDHIKGASNVTYFQESTEDITLQYVDTDSRVNALKAERDRLMALMEKAENMSDLLQIEQRLTDVLGELDRVTSQLRTYDNLVDYGTVNVNISQVQEFTPTQEQSPWQRMGEGFMESLKNLGDGIVNFFVGLVISSPYLLLAGVIAVAALLIGKKMKKKAPAKKPEEKKE